MTLTPLKKVDQRDFVEWPSVWVYLLFPHDLDLDNKFSLDLDNIFLANIPQK